MASENEKRETLADVVAIVRRAAQYYEGEAEKSEGLLRESFKLSAANYREIADRIETAWKREAKAIAMEHAVLPAVCITKPSGNAAAMRKALVKCREIALQWQADEADGVAGTTDKPQARSAAEAVIDMEFEINAALSAPARNCDVGTEKEQVRRHCGMCVSITKNGTKGCDYSKCNSCFAKWAQMPYEDEEGGAA